jgi:xanthine dehydrogenase iron-sulfur cluster and FAD-binding subunit A
VTREIVVGGWEHECCGVELVRHQRVQWTYIIHSDGRLHETHHELDGLRTAEVSGAVVDLELVQVDGSRVETVESLAGDAMLSPLQEAFKRHHALQCGFCTPGILMAADDLLSRGRPSHEEIVDMLSGQLCRCTGYAPIVAAIEDAASEPGR